MKYIMFLLIVILIAFGVQEIAEGNFKETPNSQLIINILFYVAIECCNFLCILITTRYVLRKVSILLSEQMKSAAGAAAAVKQESKDNYVALKGDVDDSKQLHEQLVQCLSNTKSFDFFMRFLAKEFSIECLLSFVEFVQFKQYMRKRMESEECDSEEEDLENGDLNIIF
eukprot:UN07696